MFLVIDLSVPNQIRVCLGAEGRVHEKIISKKNTDLLSVVDGFLRARKVSLMDLSGVAVRVGGGGFTSVRVATTLANTFAYVTQKPVIALGPQESEDFVHLVSRFGEAHPKYVRALYSAEPNISQNRSLWGAIKSKNKK